MSANQPTKTRVDYSKFLGVWINTYTETKGITQFRFYEQEGQLMVEAQGAEGGVCPGDWGSVPAYAYAYKPHMTEAYAFRVDFKMESGNALLAMNENKGLIVIAGYWSYNQDSDQSDHLIREFYYKD